MKQILLISLILAAMLLSACAASPPVINQFDVEKNGIAPNESTALIWQVTGATSITINEIGAVASQGKVIIQPSSTKAYTITASNSSATVTRAVVLIVIAPPHRATPLPSTYSPPSPPPLPPNPPK